MLCREEAQELQKNKPKLDAMGVKLVGIVKEWDDAEIKVHPGLPEVMFQIAVGVHNSQAGCRVQQPAQTAQYKPEGICSCSAACSKLVLK